MNEAEGKIGEEKSWGISRRGVRGRQRDGGKADTRESMQQEQIHTTNKANFYTS